MKLKKQNKTQRPFWTRTAVSTLLPLWLTHLFAVICSNESKAYDSD